MSFVRFNELGLKIRVASATCAVMFAAAVLATNPLARVLGGWLAVFWMFVGAGLLTLFYIVSRTDDEGNIEPAFLHALIPWPLWMPVVIWGVIAPDDGPDPFGRWHVFGDEWSGIMLYTILCGTVFVYNLLRLNLSRAMRRPR